MKMSEMAFDPDVLSAIRANHEANTGAPAAIKSAAKPTVAAPKGWQPFSSLFWEPQYIPDVPLPVFDAPDWHESVRPYIPSSEVLTHYKWPKKVTEKMALAMYLGDRTLLHGPTGTGKSEGPKAMCAKLGIPYIRITCHRRQDSTEFVGKDIIGIDPDTNLNVVRYDWPLFALAYLHGGFILVDEAFRSPVLMSIQSCFEKRGELILPDAAGLDPDERRITQPEGKGWLWLTDNTNGTGDTSGAYISEVQDLSTLDRITSTIFVDYLEKDTEIPMIEGRYPLLTKATIIDMVAFANQVRAAFKQGTMMQTFSVRALMSWAEKAELFGNINDSLVVAWADKLGPDDKALACNIFSQVFAQDLKV